MSGLPVFATVIKAWDENRNNFLARHDHAADWRIPRTKLTRSLYVARFCAVSLLFASLICHADDVVDDAQAWFINEFAPLWKNLDSTDPAALTGFWVDEYRDHPIDDDSSIWENTVERWQRNIDRGREEGLAGSTVVRMQVEEINEHAVIIRVVWKDEAVEEQFEEPFYCGTYIAGTFRGEWKFTNYFTIDCDDLLPNDRPQ